MDWILNVNLYKKCNINLFACKSEFWHITTISMLLLWSHQFFLLKCGFIIIQYTEHTSLMWGEKYLMYLHNCFAIHFPLFGSNNEHLWLFAVCLQPNTIYSLCVIQCLTTHLNVPIISCLIKNNYLPFLYLLKYAILCSCLTNKRVNYLNTKVDVLYRHVQHSVYC